MQLLYFILLALLLLAAKECAAGGWERDECSYPTKPLGVDDSLCLSGQAQYKARQCDQHVFKFAIVAKMLRGSKATSKAE